jgi:hypothetical protein
LRNSKGNKNNVSGIITLKKKGGQKEMPRIICPNCHGGSEGLYITVECDYQASQLGAQLWGIIKCLNCMHEWPITIAKGYIHKLDIALPGVQSDKLNTSVPDDIRGDVREAERAHYAQCYKASVTMCRRAVQLGLIDKGIGDKPLGKMLKEAKDIKKLLTDDTYNLATSIKHFGDIGAHREEIIEPEVARLVIFATVQMLNEIFK